MTIILITIAVFVLLLIITGRNESKSLSQSPMTDYDLAMEQMKWENRSENIHRDSHSKEPPMHTDQDQLYSQLENFHRNKTIQEIDNYIEYRRQRDDNYWERNRMEYKILKVRQRELEATQTSELIRLLNSDKINELKYSELKDHYNYIRYNLFLFPDFNLKRIEDRLDSMSYDYFLPELEAKTPSTAETWLHARQKKGEYISKLLFEKATEMSQSEDSLDRYKRMRKNIQNNISKAKKNNDEIKINELTKQLAELEIKNPG